MDLMIFPFREEDCEGKTIKVGEKSNRNQLNYLMGLASTLPKRKKPSCFFVSEKDAP